MRLRLGTRASKLAIAQTNAVIAQLQMHYPNLECEVIYITTSGDLCKDKPLYEIGGKALFLKELEIALLEGQIDVAVHSLKDVPGIMSSKFTLAATLTRTHPLDCICGYRSVFALPVGARVGTSSLRRKVQLLKLRPDLTIFPLRGNIDSRLRKLRDGLFDAIILSHAGLMRVGLDAIATPMDPSIMVPAVGQGTIVVQALSIKQDIQKILTCINCEDTAQETGLERVFLSSLQANCTVPIGAYIRKEEHGYYTADFMLSNQDGTKFLKYNCTIANPNQVKLIAQQMFCMVY